MKYPHLVISLIALSALTAFVTLFVLACSSEKLEASKAKKKDPAASADADDDDDLATDGEENADDGGDGDGEADDATADDAEADAGETDTNEEEPVPTLNDFTTMTADQLTAAWQTYGGVYELKDASLQVTTFTGEGSVNNLNDAGHIDVTLIKKDATMTDGSIEIDYDATGMTPFMIAVAMRHKGGDASDMVFAGVQSNPTGTVTNARFGYRLANKWYNSGAMKLVTETCPRAGKLKVTAIGTVLKISCNDAEVHQMDITNVPAGGTFGIFTTSYPPNKYLNKILKLDYNAP